MHDEGSCVGPMFFQQKKSYVFLILLLFLAVLFTLANGMAAAYLAKAYPLPDRYVVASLIAASFLFRIIVQPQPEALIWWLMAFEALLSLWMGGYPFLFTAIAIGYSWLAYRGFFIGEWLRTQLALFTIMRAVAVSLLGFALAVLITGKPLWSLPPLYLLSGIIYWNLFNLYEFSRLTFALEEESPQRQSHTSLYGIVRAVRLSLAQAFLATLFADVMIGQAMIALFWGLAVVFVSGIVFIVKRTAGTAIAFRYLSLAFIYYFFAMMLVILWYR